MTRTHRSARSAGTAQETLVAGYLAAELADDRIERRARNGAKDRGDIGGIRTPFGERVVLEVKNTARINLGGWWAEVEVEKGNDDAPVGAVVHKRHGKGRGEDQWVTLTLRDFARIIGGPPVASHAAVELDAHRAAVADDIEAEARRDDHDLINDDAWERAKEEPR